MLIHYHPVPCVDALPTCTVCRYTTTLYHVLMHYHPVPCVDTLPPCTMCRCTTTLYVPCVDTLPTCTVPLYSITNPELTRHLTRPASQSIILAAHVQCHMYYIKEKCSLCFSSHYSNEVLLTDCKRVRRTHNE